MSRRRKGYCVHCARISGSIQRVSAHESCFECFGDEVTAKKGLAIVFVVNPGDYKAVVNLIKSRHNDKAELRLFKPSEN